MMRNVRQKNSGFTIAEMLLAMTITALLLTALAASINASMVNLNANEGIYKTINNARQTLSRMTSELRTSQGVAVYEAFGLCTFVNAEGETISYWRWGGNDTFGLKKDTVYLTRDSQNYVLCSGVKDISFTKGLDPADPNVVRNVRISMTVNHGDVTKKMATAAVIMRNMP
ncbi:MAG: prepilin-type N-terminal cleavage/methylation domain-containing protein [Phycisphaerae bacterium]|nr:prepilin-type N-terminal cleavage/methylation domain-containing protein [Phycisphaerae bacterium]